MEGWVKRRDDGVGSNDCNEKEWEGGNAEDEESDENPEAEDDNSMHNDAVDWPQKNNTTIKLLKGGERMVIPGHRGQITRPPGAHSMRENVKIVAENFNTFACIYRAMILIPNVCWMPEPSIPTLAHNVRMMPVCLVWVPLDHGRC